MQGFARWVGGLAAATAGVLAVVWVLEARPDSRPAAQDPQEARCRFNEVLLNSHRMVEGRPLLSLGCQAPPEWRQTWDQPRLMQGLTAGAVAAVLLLLAGRRHD